VVVVGSLVGWTDLLGFDPGDVADCAVPCRMVRLGRALNRACVTQAR
jgi:hypothetical protein